MSMTRLVSNLKPLEIKLRLTFTDPLLGTVPGNALVFSEHIQSKEDTGKDLQDELEFVPNEEIAKGTTWFMRNEQGPFLFDYMIRGLMKEACGALSRDNKTESAKLKAFKKVINGLVFVKERALQLQVPKIDDEKKIYGLFAEKVVEHKQEDGSIRHLYERPLRAQTAQGERTCLARSEILPAGTSVELTLLLMKRNLKKFVFEWLGYGQYQGLCQWRNAGFGRFVTDFEILNPEEGDDKEDVKKSKGKKDDRDADAAELEEAAADASDK